MEEVNEEDEGEMQEGGEEVKGPGQARAGGIGSWVGSLKGCS